MYRCRRASGNGKQRVLYSKGVGGSCKKGRVTD